MATLKDCQDQECGSSPLECSADPWRQEPADDLGSCYHAAARPAIPYAV